MCSDLAVIRNHYDENACSVGYMMFHMNGEIDSSGGEPSSNPETAREYVVAFVNLMRKDDYENFRLLPVKLRDMLSFFCARDTDGQYLYKMLKLPGLRCVVKFELSKFPAGMK